MRNTPSTYLAIGITAGLLLGAGVSYVYLKDRAGNIEKQSVPTISTNISSSPQKEVKPLVKEEAQIISEAQAEVKQSIQEIEANIQQAAKQEKIELEVPQPIDSIIPQVIDSLPQDSTLDIYEDSLVQDPDVPTIILNTDEIRVKREVLLSKSSTYVILHDSSIYNSIKTNSIDSLIEETSEVTIQNKHLYRIEYWETPIHYKGYKMANNKLVLYGLEPDPNNKLVLLEDHLYFRHAAGVFHIQPTFESMPFSRVKDEYIIQQLQ